MTKEEIVHAYMVAIGDEKLSEEAWKRMAKVNRRILDSSSGRNMLFGLVMGALYMLIWFQVLSRGIV